MTFSEVLPKVEEFEFSGGIPADELVVAESHRAVRWEIVEVRVIPEKRALGAIRGWVFRRELLHVRSAVIAVELGRLRMKRNRGILPPHVVDKEEDDIGLAGERLGEDGGKSETEEEGVIHSGLLRSDRKLSQIELTLDSVMSHP
jgi:hypothetical protein